MSNAREVVVEKKPRGRRPRDGRIGRVVVPIAVGAVALAAGWYVGASRRGEARDAADKATATADRTPDPVSVRVVRPSPGGIRRTSSQIGSVHPFEMAELFAKVSGYLAKLYVDYGDRVKAGQTLAEIDVPENLDELHHATAGVALAKSVVLQAEAQLKTAKAERAAFAAAVEKADAEVERYVSMRSYHEKKLERYRDLVHRNAIPQEVADEELENYESNMANEAASHKAVLHAHAELAAAEARVDKAKADVAVAKADVAVAEARLSKAQTFVAYMKILAPYDGVITLRTLFPGAFVRSAAEGETVPLLTVARTDKVRIVTVVPDRDVPYADVGDDVEIVLDALPDQTLKGKVSRFSDSEDPDSRTMHTEIDLPNPDDVLRPGMYGVATIILDQPTKAVTLPAAALIGEPRKGEGEVYVVKKGVAHKTSVKLGADDGIRFEVLSGIDKDDRVILDPGSVSDGASVKAEAAAAKDETSSMKPAAPEDETPGKVEPPKAGSPMEAVVPMDETSKKAEPPSDGTSKKAAAPKGE